MKFSFFFFSNNFPFHLYRGKKAAFIVSPCSMTSLNLGTENNKQLIKDLSRGKRFTEIRVNKSRLNKIENENLIAKKTSLK